jgi:hypothetical protein
MVKLPFCLWLEERQIWLESVCGSTGILLFTIFRQQTRFRDGALVVDTSGQNSCLES